MGKIVTVKKTIKYNKNFLQGDIGAIGEAAGKLKPTGFKLYIYLLGNANDYTFELLPSAFANWQDGGYSENGVILDENKRRAINKSVKDGLDNLIETGYIEKIGVDKYVFYEKGKEASKEQKVPVGSIEGTNCSYEVEAKEQKVPGDPQPQTFGF